MRDEIRDFLRSLPWRRIIAIAIGLGFIALEFWSPYRMGRRSAWIVLGIISLSVGASEEPLFRGDGFGGGGFSGGVGPIKRKKWETRSKGVVQRAREKRLAKKRPWRKDL